MWETLAPSSKNPKRLNSGLLTQLQMPTHTTQHVISSALASPKAPHLQRTVRTCLWLQEQQAFQPPSHTVRRETAILTDGFTTTKKMAKDQNPCREILDHSTMSRNEDINVNRHSYLLDILASTYLSTSARILSLVVKHGSVELKMFHRRDGTRTSLFLSVSQYVFPCFATSHFWTM